VKSRGGRENTQTVQKGRLDAVEGSFWSVGARRLKKQGTGGFEPVSFNVDDGTGWGT